MSAQIKAATPIAVILTQPAQIRTALFHGAQAVYLP